MKQQLALDPGDNTIEVVAYNASNLLASLPARTTIKIPGSAAKVKPTLHVLAIGINAYVDQGWKPAGSDEVLAFPPLKLAVSDAKSLATAFKRAGSGQYAEVKVTEALDTDATATGLQHIIERMASEIDPRDTFVLFAAAHGSSHNGRFYLIPQDYDGGTNPVSLQETGHWPGPAAGLGCQSDQGKEDDPAARYLRVGCARRWLHALAHRCAGGRGGDRPPA